MSYDFSGLTNAQHALLTFQGWQVGQANPDRSPCVQPSERTVRKLIERGLVIPHERDVPAGPFTMSVTEYEVPIDVHMAWCEYCAQQETD